MGNNLPEVPPLESPIQKQRPVRPWDLFNKNKERVVQEIHDERMEICRDCPFFVKITGQCKECGCFMEQKTKLAEASCPKDYWQAVKINVNAIDFKESE